MSKRSAVQHLDHLQNAEFQRWRFCYEQLSSGKTLPDNEILGFEIPDNATVYPAGLFDTEFLGLVVSLYPRAFVRVPATFTQRQYEEIIGFPFSKFLELVDEGRVIPITQPYTAYIDPKLIVPIAIEKRCHLPDQRITLLATKGDQERWSRLYKGILSAQEIFPSAESTVREVDDLYYVQGIHSAYGLLCAMGFEQALKETLIHYRGAAANHSTTKFEPVIEAMKSKQEDDILFGVCTFLSTFMTDVFCLGAVGQLDENYEAVISIPLKYRERFNVFPTCFARRLLDWLDVDVPVRMLTRDFDMLQKSGITEALQTKISDFKSRVEGCEFETAADEAASIKEMIDELNRAYRKMEGLKKFGKVLSTISFAAIPLSLTATTGLLGAALGPAVGLTAKAALDRIKQDDLLASNVFNPLLRRLPPWKMDAATYQLCHVKGINVA